MRPASVPHHMYIVVLRNRATTFTVMRTPNKTNNYLRSRGDRVPPRGPAPRPPVGPRRLARPGRGGVGGGGGGGRQLQLGGRGQAAQDVQQRHSGLLDAV